MAKPTLRVCVTLFGRQAPLATDRATRKPWPSRFGRYPAVWSTIPNESLNKGNIRPFITEVSSDSNIDNVDAIDAISPIFFILSPDLSKLLIAPPPSSIWVHRLLFMSYYQALLLLCPPETNGTVLALTAECTRRLFTNVSNGLQGSTAVLLILKHLLTLHTCPLQTLKMPKRKHESSPPPPPPHGVSPSQGIFCSAPSFTETEVEKTEDGWDYLKTRAHERLNRFEVTKESEKLLDCFGGLLDWLPPGGGDYRARHSRCGIDEMLVTTFENIRTCLLQPSTCMQT